MSTASVQLTPGARVESGRVHYYQLDSLRGLAAIAVAIHHWHIVWSWGPHSKYVDLLLQMLPFRLMLSGHASVMMFFVLSGFVLSLPQISGKTVAYLPYLIKRICRIYLPYLVALGIAILGCWKWHGHRSYGPWVELSWPTGPQWGSVVQHILFLGAYPAVYNSAFWSLITEMRISLIFPFVCALAIKLGRTGSLVLSFVFFLLGGVLGNLVPIPGTFCVSISCLGMFVMGIFLARWLPQLQVRLKKLDSKRYWSLFLLSVLIYAYTPSFFFARHWRNPSWDGIAAGLILFSLTDRHIEGALRHRFIVFLGRISYSIYLIHMPILLTFCFLFYGKLRPAFWFAPYLVITIAFATAMYHAVELPCIRLGRELVSKVSAARRASHGLAEF